MRQTAPSLKGAASNVAFRYVPNVETFRLDTRVTYDNFHYAATCGKVMNVFSSGTTYLSGYYCEDEKGRGSIPVACTKNRLLRYRVTGYRDL
jgi:hypothetical protein